MRLPAHQMALIASGCVRQEEQAAQKFAALIKQCMDCKTTRVNNLVHILAH